MKYVKLFEEFSAVKKSSKKESLKKGKIEVKTSTIPNAGKGLFALQDFSKGDEICEFTGKEVSKEEIKKLTGTRAEYLIGKDDGSTVDVYNSKSPAKYSNDHDGYLKATKKAGFEKKNNCEIMELDNGELWLIATKKIKEGDEIFCSYGSSYWTNWLKSNKEK
jgi:hypothetical protein